MKIKKDNNDNLNWEDNMIIYYNYDNQIIICNKIICKHLLIGLIPKETNEYWLRG